MCIYHLKVHKCTHPAPGVHLEHRPVEGCDDRKYGKEIVLDSECSGCGHGTDPPKASQNEAVKRDDPSHRIIYDEPEEY